MNFYKRHLGDIAKACGHLSQGAMGAYDLLLDWHYAKELPLPLTKPELYRIGRAFTKAERDNVDQILSLFFLLTDTGYVQKRALEEMAKASAQADTNRRIAEEREAARRAANEARNEHESCTNRSTKDQPSQTPDSRQEQEHESTNVDSSAGKPANPPCPQQEIIALYHETLPELRRVRVWTGTRPKLLASRWRESADRQSLAWWGKYFGYVRKSRFLMGHTTGRDGRGFDCDLEWLVRPANFAKVIEGKYEDAQ